LKREKAEGPLAQVFLAQGQRESEMSQTVYTQELSVDDCERRFFRVLGFNS